MADQEPDKQPEQELEPEAPEEPKEPEQELEPEEEALAEPQEPEREPEEEQPAEPREPQQEPEQMSRRKAKRLEKLEGLVQHLRGEQPQPQPKNQGINYRELIEADDKVYEQLDKVAQDFGQTQFNAGLEQANAVRFHTRLEIDAPRIESKFTQFDQNSPDFNPGVVNAINEWYLASVGYDPKTDTVKNPNVRYVNFVEGIMELADAMAGAKSTQSAQNIAQQAANAGLRPGGTGAKSLNLNKAPEQMSDEELDAAISATMPRDTRGRFTSQK